VTIRILSLFVRYGDKDYEGAYEALTEFYMSVGDVCVTSVLIDNALEPGLSTDLDNTSHLISGDNSRREFSGWDAALSAFAERMQEFDLVHLVTSAFQNEYNGFYPLIDHEMLEYVAQTKRVMLAHVDAYPEKVKLYGRSFQTWACSKFLFSRPENIFGLGMLVGPFSESDLFSADASACFLPDAPLSVNYQSYLVDWLTGDGLPHGKWHSTFEYSKETSGKFRSKALSILDEHNLSMRIRESGVQIVDFTWWHANRRALASEGKVIPPEIIQVQERNLFLFGNAIVNGAPPEEVCGQPNVAIEKLLTKSDAAAPFDGELEDAIISGFKVAFDVNRFDRDIVRAAILMSAGYRFSEFQKSWFRNISEGVCAEGALSVSRGLIVKWLSRIDLYQKFDLKTESGVIGLLKWWFVESGDKPDLLDLVDLGFLEEPIPGLAEDSDSSRSIAKGEYLLWLTRLDLQESFNIYKSEGRRLYIEWIDVFASNSMNSIPDKRPEKNLLVAKGTYYKGGVNVIGYGRGGFGIGEDSRMAIKALSCSDFEVCAPRLPLTIAAAENDDSISGYEVQSPLFQTNLICLPHFETLRVLAATGREVLDCRYNIGAWQWELSGYPDEVRCALDIVDEIWSSSDFTENVMKGVTEKPVIHMPMVVCLPEEKRKWGREDFNIPCDDFVFLTILDGNSSIRRKNPLAVVRAFLAAFPYCKGVRLVIKAMNINPDHPDWSRIASMAEKDERIHIIVETMEKDKLLGLQQVCDCFVSLHRSEGFGRNIAEAMLLGKPVVVSAYSGNLDFTRTDTAFMVGGGLIPLEPGDYMFYEGQHWYDPDVDSAADCMLRCVEDAAMREALARSGRAIIQEKYSVEVVSAAYAARLDVLHI